MLKRGLIGAGGTLGGGVSYWLGLLGGTGTDEFRACAVDSNGEIIAVGRTTSDGAGLSDCLIAKYDSSGTLLWDRTLGGAGNDDIFHSAAVDSADNIIAVGQTNSDGAGGLDALISKYDSSGTLIWDRTLGGTGGDLFYSAAVDSADNIIAVGYTASDGAGNNDCLIAKYDSSGALLWDRTLGGADTDLFFGLSVDSADNIIAVGYTDSDGAGTIDCLIAKYDSSGTLLWDRTFGGISNDLFFSAAVDSADNIIAVGYTASSTTPSGLVAFIAKYASSGTLLWRRHIGSTGSEIFRGAAVDSADNIIAVGQTNSDGAGGLDALIYKYDSSGTLLWDRTLGGTGNDVFYCAAVDSADNIIAVGHTISVGAGSNDCLIAKLPPDGSGVGTYGGLTYQDAALIGIAASIVDAVAVLTDAPAALTDAVAVLTDATAILTEEFFEIPA